MRIHFVTQWQNAKYKKKHRKADLVEISLFNWTVNTALITTRHKHLDSRSYISIAQLVNFFAALRIIYNNLLVRPPRNGNYRSWLNLLLLMINWTIFRCLIQLHLFSIFLTTTTAINPFCHKLDTITMRENWNIFR